MLAMNNDEDEQEDEFRTAEDQHQSERHEEFFTPPEQQLLNEQAMHSSEGKHKSATPDVMDTSEDHRPEEAVVTSKAERPTTKTPQPVPRTIVHQASEEPTTVSAPASTSPTKLAPVSLEPEIPVASPEEIQEMAKILDLEMEKEAVDMDNAIRDTMLSEDQFDFGKLTQSISDSRAEETAANTEPNLERLQSVSEAEQQAAVEAFVTGTSTELQRNESLFSPPREEPIISGNVQKTAGEEEPKATSIPVGAASLTETRVETEVHVDLEIREKFGATKEPSAPAHDGEQPSQPAQHQTPPVQSEAETPQGFPVHYVSEDFKNRDPGTGRGLGGQQGLHRDSQQEERHKEHPEQHPEEHQDSQTSDSNRVEASESLTRDEIDVTLEPKEEESEEVQPQGWDSENNNSGEYFNMTHQPQHPSLNGIAPHMQPPLESPNDPAHGPALHLPPMLSPVSETASQPIELPRILPQIQFSQPQNLPPGLPQQLMSSIPPSKRPRLGSKSKSHDREPSPVHTSAPPPAETVNHASSRTHPQHSPPSNPQHSPSLVNGSLNAPAEPEWSSYTAREQRFVDQSPPFPSPQDVARRQPVVRHEDATPRVRSTPREERDRQVMGPPSRLPDRFGPQLNNITPTRQRLAAKLAARTAAAGNQQRTPKSAAPQRIGSLEIREVSSDRLEERLQRRLQERMREKMKSRRIKEEPPRKARQEQRLAETLRQRLEQDFDRGSREPSVARVTEPQRRPLHVNRSRAFGRREDDYGRFDQDDGFDDYSRDKRRQPFERRPNAFVNRPADTHREETLRWTQEQRTRIREEIGHTPVNRNRPPVPEWTPESAVQPEFPDFDDRDEPPGKKMRYDYDPVHEDHFRTMASTSREDSRIAHRLQEAHSSIYQSPQNQRSQQNQTPSANPSTRDFHTMEMNLPWPFPGIQVKRYRFQDPGFHNLQASATQATVPEDDQQLDGEDEIDDADHHSLQSAQVVSPRDVYQQQPDEDSENSGEDDGTDYLSQSQNAYLQPPPAQPTTKRRRGRPRGSGKIQIGTRGPQESEYPNESMPSTRGGTGTRRGRPPGRPVGSGRGRGKAAKTATEAHDSPTGQAYSTPRRASGQGSTAFPSADNQAYYSTTQSTQGSNKASKENVDGSAPKKRGRPRKTFPLKEDQAYFNNGAGRTGESSRANGAHNGDDPSLS
jgi:hypothetical protein